MVSSISGDTLEKAIKELNEDPEKREEQIKEFRDRLEAWRPNPEDPLEENLRLSRIEDDKFLLRYLRARKFDMDRAVSLFVNYFKFRAKYSDILGEVSPEAAAPVLKENLVSVLPHRSPQGSKVLALRFARADLDNLPIGSLLKMMLVVLDKLIEDEETQIHGVILCQDLEGMTFLKMTSLLRREHFSRGIIFELLQESFPGRLKGLHLLHQPWYISIALNIIRPFMKQKTKDRFHLHGEDYDSLKEFLPASVLPSEYGGELDSVETYSAWNLFSDQLDSNSSQ